MLDIVVSQLGARQKYFIPLAFLKAGSLKALFTDFWSPFGMQGKTIANAVKINALMRMASRWSPDLPANLIHSYNLLGIQMGFRLKSKESLKRSEAITFFGQEFASKVAKDIQRVTHKAYFGFCSESLEVLEVEKKAGSFTILDQYDAANDEHLFIEEHDRWPGWKTNYERTPLYYERVYKEWELADVILVNSEWTRKMIIQQGAESNKIRILPQPYVPRGKNSKPIKKKKNFRVIYVGAVNLRKGVQYLLSAAELLKKSEIEFLIVGGGEVPEGLLSKLSSNVTFTGHLPFEKVKELLLSSEVFVFPTLSDGFGRVQLEAMDFGLPVISTTNCGNIVEHGKNGFVVPVCDAEAIANHILYLYENRDVLEEMQINAISTVDKYSVEGFVNSIKGIFGE